MNRKALSLTSFWAALLITATIATAADAVQLAEQNWGQWRGPWSTGVAPQADPPIEWSEDEGKNIRWKTQIPGLGHSSPVVWGDRVYLTTALPHGPKLEPRYSKMKGAHDNSPVTQRQKFIGLAVDRATGKILWQKELNEALPHEGHHNTGSMASNSPVTDGERVYFFFGSFGLFCLDREGKKLWEARLGEMLPLHGHGEGSTPALFGETLVVNWDHEENSFVVAFDKRSGRERWRKKRDEKTSWSSPIIIELDGKPQAIISATNRIRGYDLATGEELWTCGGLSTNVVASPVYAEGMLFTGSSYETRILLAIRLDRARGDITGSKRVVWEKHRATPYVPSPLLYGDALYYMNHYQGVMTRVSAQTGDDRPGPFRLQGLQDIYSSPVAASGRVYVTDRNGKTLVFSHAEKPEVLALNQVDESVSATAAIAGHELFLRGEHSLYSIAEPPR